MEVFEKGKLWVTRGHKATGPVLSRDSRVAEETPSTFRTVAVSLTQ